VHRLRQNLIFKILSLLGAFALFLYVRKQQASESPDFFLPLELSPPPGLTVVEPTAPRQVRVKLRGPAEQIRSLDDTQLKAYVDLAGRQKGYYHTLPVQVQLPHGISDQVQVVYRSPTRLSIRLDAFSVKEFQVEPVMLTEPPDGYSVGLPRVSPPTVEIRGLSEAVRRVRAVQAAVTEIRSTERVDQLVRVNALDEQGKEVGDGLQIRPPTVRVRAPVERSIWTRPLYVDAVLGPLPAGTRVKRLVVTPERVVATGPDEALARLWIVRTRPVAVPPQGVRVDQTVALEIPPGVRGLSPSTVRVEVELEGVSS
jgi:YbbR domain-containing protein